MTKLDINRPYNIAELLKAINFYTTGSLIFKYDNIEYVAQMNNTYCIKLTLNKKENIMFDESVSMPRLKTLHPKIRDEAISIFNEIEKNGIKVRCTYAMRTFAEQQTLYNQGRTTPGNIVTNAMPGYSFHQYGLALDFCLIHNDKQISWSMTEDLDNDRVPDWVEVANTFKKYGWTWGGDWANFKDYPHVEKPFGLNINTALNLYNAKKFDSEGYIIIERN